MAVYTKHQFSSVGDGGLIFVSATASAGAIEIHAVQATATNATEVVTIYGLNSATGTPNVIARLLWGGATAPQENIHELGRQATAAVGNPSSAGLQLLADHIPLLASGTHIEAWSTSTEGFHLLGYVDRIATATA